MVRGKPGFWNFPAGFGPFRKEKVFCVFALWGRSLTCAVLLQTIYKVLSLQKIKTPVSIRGIHNIIAFILDPYIDVEVLCKPTEM